jgi:transposase
MKKRSYRAVKVQDINAEKIARSIDRTQPCILGIDVAKEDFYAGVGGADGRAKHFIKWKHPVETRDFLRLVSELQKAGFRLQAAMEPSGTYGEALRYQLQRLEVPVYRVDPKRCHDLAMVLDGVDSQHDPKSASLLVYMQSRALSQPWPQQSEQRKELRARVMKRELYADPLRRHYGRLEATLAAHWPELSYILDVYGGSILALLLRYPSPAEVARDAEGAATLLRKYSRGRLGTEKIDQVIESAKNTLAVPMNAVEQEVLKALVEEIERLGGQEAQCDEILKQFARQSPATRNMCDTVGLITSVVLVALAGEPSEYACAQAYQKALGLNLKERSSGKHKGRLKITKRGSGTARKYLYMAALRLIYKDPVVSAWYDKRVHPEHKRQAVVAVMRKLAKALWHISRGSTFDATKLFDVRRLDLGEQHKQAA